MGGTRGSGNVSSAADVLGMAVVCRMTGVGGVCEMCMCLARGGEGSQWIRGLGCGGVSGEWIWGLEGWCGVMSV